MIEGLTELQGPLSILNEGHLPLPPDFPRDRLVGRWVEEGPQMQKARQQEMIPSARVAAAGWETWKDTAGKKCTRSLGKAAYILMCRAKPLQAAVNKLHGNTSRMRLVGEIKGETIAGTPAAEAEGVLSNAELDARGMRELGKDYQAEGELPPLNRVDLKRETAAETVEA